MDKTVAALMVAMVASVMAIPLAYLAGKGSAESSISAAVEDELARTRSAQEGQLAALRQELAETTLEQERASNSTREALWKAGISVEPESTDDGAGNAPVSTPVSQITFEVFDGFAIGTSYEQIAKAVGSSGELKLNIQDEDGSSTRQFAWEWTADDGTPGKMELFFVDGLLQDKSYKG